MKVNLIYKDNTNIVEGYQSFPLDEETAVEIPEEIEACFISGKHCYNGEWFENTNYAPPINVSQLKAKLEAYKYDIQQVDLFGMERDDYEEKKAMCREIIIQLRELEKEENKWKE